MIPKSGYRFSETIMLKQDRMMPDSTDRLSDRSLREKD
jgi:hypothetical protein